MLFVGLLSCCVSIAQTEIDSLKKQLNKNIQDTDRVFTLHELGMAYYLTSPDSAIKFWRTAISYSEKALKIKTNKLERSVLLQAQGYSLGALAYMMQGASMQDSAVLLMEKSLHNFVELGDTKGAAQVLQNLSSHYQEIANYDKAIEISNIVINLCKKTKDLKTLGFAYQNLGLAYFNYGKVSLAIEFFQKSLAARNSIRDTIGLGHAYYELGIIYRSLKEPKEALDYFLKSLEHRVKSDDIAGVGATENEIAALYIGELRNLQEAKKYLKDSREHLEKINDLLRLGFLYSNYGTYYYETGNMDSAFYYFNKGLEVRKSSGDRKGISLSRYLIGKIYLHEKKFDKAIENGLAAYDGGIKYKSVDLTKKAADILRLAYSGKGDWKKAYFYFEIFKRSSDSLFNAENQKLGIKSRMNLEFERVKESLKTEEEKKRMLIASERDKQKTRTIYSIVLLILVSMFSVFIINRLRVIKKQKKIIEAQNLEVVKQKSVIEEKQKEMLDSIHYAYRIQKALLSSEKYISRNLDRLRKGTGQDDK
jgi:tetratricopeptide (TPR) repeat protein